MGGHDGIIGIHTCVSFMKVSCADAGNVSVTGTDMYQFGMNLQSLHSEDNVDAASAFFCSVDVGCFVETCQ